MTSPPLPRRPVYGTKPARRRHEASERRRSAHMMELERQRQLEQLEQISRQDKRLSASARSMARHRVKAAKLEAEAARTAAADELSASAAAAAAAAAAAEGGEGSSFSLAGVGRPRRKGSSLTSFDAPDLKDSKVNRLVRRHQLWPRSQDLRG